MVLELNEIVITKTRKTKFNGFILWRHKFISNITE